MLVRDAKTTEQGNMVVGGHSCFASITKSMHYITIIISLVHSSRQTSAWRSGRHRVLTRLVHWYKACSIVLWPKQKNVDKSGLEPETPRIQRHAKRM